MGSPTDHHEDDESLVQFPRRRALRPSSSVVGLPGRGGGGVPVQDPNALRPADEEHAPPADPPPPAPPRAPLAAAESDVYDADDTQVMEAAPAPGATIPSSDFADGRFVRRTPPRPTSGWRRVVLELSGGRWNPGLSPAEQSRRQLEARLLAPVQGCRRIAVLSRKGGVGKTSVTLGLGHTFATIRPDRVVALDANPDAGTLGYRLDAAPNRTLTDLLADADRITRYSDVRSYTAQAPSRLEVMASDDDPRITRAVGEHEYEAAIDVLERHYNLLLTDTGTDITHSVMQGILAAADQVVVVAGPNLDGARAAAKTFDWLEQNGHGYLVKTAVVALNDVHKGGLVDLHAIRNHFDDRCRAVVAIPHDRHLEAGAQTSLEDLHPATRHAYVELAAAVADGFGPAR